MKHVTAGMQKKVLIVFFIIIALNAVGIGLSDSVMANYFKDVYNVNAMQRGFIELPRELPGILLIVFISVLGFLGDIRLSIIAQALSAIGIAIMGFLTPPFGMMLVFLFVNSLGMHLFMPLQDGIGMALIEDEKSIGKRMGQYKAVNTTFVMLAGLLVFLGFRFGFFSFMTQTKWIFVIACIAFAVCCILFIYLNKYIQAPKPEKFRILFRKKYKYYYILAIMNGVQKQIMFVFGPWVFIELLMKKADTLSLLTMAGGLCGMILLPYIGKWIDRFGVKKLLYVDALTFIGVYLAYGILTTGFHTGAIALTGIPVLIAYLLFIFDRLSMQFSIVRTVYLQKIVDDPSELTPTLSMGISMDHIVSIACATVAGSIWTFWGPQYIFFLAAGLSCINLLVAKLVVIQHPAQ